jgi:transmembrane sensor
VSEPRIEVPPLSDLSRQRIRQAVFERLDREPLAAAPPLGAPSPRRRTAALALALAAAAGLVAFLVLGGGGERRPIARSPSPSRLVTGDTPSQVTVGDARITAGPHAALTVNEAGDAGVQVLIERGAIEFAVAPRGDRPPFVVLASDVRVEVIGTVFTVARDGEDVTVAVARGVVRVTRAGEEAHVAAGQSWPAKRAAAPELPPAAAAPPSGDEPELTFAPEPARSARPKRKPEPPPPAPAATPSARERYEVAAALEKTRPEEALATYRALAAERGAWADNALFAQGRLELELGRKGAARRSLAAYLERYPRGANAGLARALLDGLP